MKGLAFGNLGLLALTTSVSAPVVAEGFNYNYVEAAYVDTEIDVGPRDVDGDGIALGGSFELSDVVFLTADYTAQDFDFNVDLDQWSVGIGGHLPVSDTVDVVGSLSYINAEVETNFGDSDENGIGLGVGLRAKIIDNVELEGGINYVDLDDAGDDTFLAVRGRYYINEEFAVGAGFQVGDDVTSWSIGLRYEFL